MSLIAKKVCKNTTYSRRRQKILKFNICQNIKITLVKNQGIKISAMWYLVNLPGNKLNVAVKTEKHSIAADCLNKVSVQCDIMKIVIFSAP